MILEKTPVNSKGTRRLSIKSTAKSFTITVLFPDPKNQEKIELIVKDALNGKCEYGTLPKIPFNSVKAAEAYIKELIN